MPSLGCPVISVGGDGRVNFAVPDLRGRVPSHMGQGLTLGQKAGEEAHTLSITEIAQHAHPVKGFDSAGNAATPVGNSFAHGVVPGQPAINVYGSAPSTTLIPSAVGNTGGSQAHENRQPFLTLSFCIALQGIFPSQN